MYIIVQVSAGNSWKSEQGFLFFSSESFFFQKKCTLAGVRLGRLHIDEPICVPEAIRLFCNCLIFPRIRRYEGIHMV